MRFDGRIEPLAATHDRRNFSCGDTVLDDYLRRLARQHAASKISRTYVAAQGVKILGYYSLAMSAIRKEQLPEQYQKRFPRYPVPVVRLAVDQQAQGSGLGKLLLMDALFRCDRLSSEIGSVGVLVDAKHERVQSFYRQFGFVEFPDALLTMWLHGAGIVSLFRW